jgi:hypothetical protein
MITAHRRRTQSPSAWFSDGVRKDTEKLVGCLKERARRERAEFGPRELTACDLLQSEVVGLWADREDVIDSLTFAR